VKWRLSGSGQRIIFYYSRLLEKAFLYLSVRLLWICFPGMLLSWKTHGAALTTDSGLEALEMGLLGWWEKATDLPLRSGVGQLRFSKWVVRKPTPPFTEDFVYDEHASSWQMRFASMEGGGKSPFLGRSLDSSATSIEVLFLGIVRLVRVIEGENLPHRRRASLKRLEKTRWFRPMLAGLLPRFD